MRSGKSTVLFPAKTRFGYVTWIERNGRRLNNKIDSVPFNSLILFFTRNRLDSHFSIPCEFFRFVNGRRESFIKQHLNNAQVELRPELPAPANFSERREKLSNRALNSRRINLHPGSFGIRGWRSRLQEARSSAYAPEDKRAYARRIAANRHQNKHPAYLPRRIC